MNGKILDERTANIIMICKGHSDYREEENSIDNIRQYMSDSCLCSIDIYTDYLMEDILRTAYLDFIDCCDNPRFFMSTFFEIKNREQNYRRVFPNCHESMPSDMEILCRTFAFVQVCKRGEVSSGISTYINGFTEENSRWVRKIEN